MFGNSREATMAVAAMVLAILGMGASMPASAECACLCVEEVAYEVCTGIVTTQTITESCTEQLQCPTDPGSDTGSDGGSDPSDDGDGESDPSGESDDDSGQAGLDCRIRNVYRPDRGEYVAHPVCMPARVASTHDRLRAKRRELKQRYEEKQERRDSHGRRGKGPHESWQHAWWGAQDD